MGKVLVLGNDTRSFLAMVRSLGRRNLCVHVGCCPPSSLALHSKYVVKVHDVPSYSSNGDSWKRSLVSILEDEQFDLVIPCHDDTIIPLQTHRADLGRFACIPFLDERAFEIAFDKFKTNELASSLGIRLPKEKRVSDLEGIQAIISEFQLPVVLKPRASFSMEDLTSKRHVYRVFVRKDLESLLPSLLARGEEVVVQEYFKGTLTGLDLLVFEGEVLFAFQHVAIGQRVAIGANSYRKSVAPNPDLLTVAAKLVKALNYTGVIEVEFIFNFDTGEWVFLEVNGRFCGCLPLALSSGADLPYYFYQLLIEGKREFPQSYEAGLYCRNLRMDLGWIGWNLAAGHSDPIFSQLPRWQVAQEIVNILTLRERNDTLVIDDPKPGLVDLGGVAHRVARKVFSTVRV